MRNQPRCIDALYEKLVSLGYSDALIQVKEEQMVKSLQAQALDAQKERRKTAMSASAVEPDDDDDQASEDSAPPEKDLTPDKISVVADMTVNALRDKVLCVVELGHFSARNLRAMKETTGPQKQTLLKLYEFVTGEQPDTLQLRGRHRCYHKFGKFNKHRNESRGRRGISLTLPPNWPEDGTYQILGLSKDTPGTLLVQHRFVQSIASISAKVLPAFADLEELMVDCNWSEKSACIVNKRCPTNGRKTMLSPYFVKDLVKEEAPSEANGSDMGPPISTPAKRPRLSSGASA